MYVFFFFSFFLFLFSFKYTVFSLASKHSHVLKVRTVLFNGLESSFCQCHDFITVLVFIFDAKNLRIPSLKFGKFLPGRKWAMDLNNALVYFYITLFPLEVLGLHLNSIRSVVIHPSNPEKYRFDTNISSF